MRLGKACVQAARACEEIQSDYRLFEQSTEKEAIMESWKADCINKRITVYVDNEQELINFENLAKELNWFYSSAIDIGLTEFKNQRTYTCLVIGPDLTETLQPYFSNLKLA